MLTMDHPTLCIMSLPPSLSTPFPYTTLFRSVEVTDKDGYTALHWAAQSGHEAVVQVLVEKGADVEAPDKYGYTARSEEHTSELQSLTNLVFRLLLEKNNRGVRWSKDGRLSVT